MEMQDNDTLEDLDTSLDGVQSLSLLKEAQRRRQERERTLFLDVPSWDGDMICEYRVVPPEELRRIAERTMRRVRNSHGDSGSTNDIDIIIAASVGLYM